MIPLREFKEQEMKGAASGGGNNTLVSLQLDTSGGSEITTAGLRQDITSKPHWTHGGPGRPPNNWGGAAREEGWTRV